MLRDYPTLDAARRAFDEVAEREPRLYELWSLCREAAPPVHEPEPDDAFDVDLYDVDTVVRQAIDEGWCAEDFFQTHIKSDLLLLVGMHRPTGPEELRTYDVYETVYAALFDWALERSCPCCRASEPAEEVAHG